MKTKSHLLFTLLGILSATISTATFAESGTFPPQNLNNANNFPPQTTGQNSWNRSQPRYPAVPNYAQTGPRMPVAPRMPMPSFATQPYNNMMNPPQRFAPRTPNYGSLPSYGTVPRQTVPRQASRYNAPQRYTPYPQKNIQQNSGSRNNMPFSGGNMPFMNNGNNNSFGNFPSNPMSNMFGNNGNNKMPFFGNTRNKNRKKAWGEERHIWPDFYTDFTDDAWDTASSGPRDLGVMPGGWRFPHISTPDPVTVSDAITNQFPPIGEEMGNMMDFSDWGVFDDK